MMNFTNITKNLNEFNCREWCIDQHVTGFNNVETTCIMFAAGSILMIYIYEILNETKYKDYAPQFIGYAKILLYIFFFIYFIVIKMRLYYYV